MKLLTVEDILNDSSYYTSYEKLRYIENNMVGRVCHRHIHLLPVIREALLRLYGDGFCREYVEIGTLHGGSMSLMMHQYNPPHCTGIDLFDYYGGEIDTEGFVVSEDIAYCNIERNLLNGMMQRPYQLIQANSQHVDFSLLPKKIQFLFIDGDHSYEGVKKDFYRYEGLVERGGVIVFDDYMSIPSVNKAIQDIIRHEGTSFNVLKDIPNKIFHDHSTNKYKNPKLSNLCIFQKL